ncbi:hypothetical protein ABB37_04799 [Leptomonas pyrrhocoris]|uniref:Uncharacterized protein n=1 Tax=Leptomonas pyrrhocoris TaxID=157538 RepID=A0A0M9G1Z4_LEPPY|nr:hypothetical protein ABB37_04799 [Leptomonas pyrrhocoris]KPA80603.1 hypothetical protein ABB37_04799 [Leptomonas pyrrhocoris]|eukprot:XP_015659042.1 hypothetical protein ABB37_04799 [Leptomonas pyrrhocoris]
MLSQLLWAWDFFLFILRGTFVALADFWVMYVRAGRVWLGKRNQPSSLVRGDLVMQLAASSPHHSTANEKNIFLQLNSTFIDRRLWMGLDDPGTGPSAIVTGISYGGIGFYTTLNLLLSGVNVHGVARTARQAERARQLLTDAVDRQIMLHKEWSGRVGRFLVHVCNMSDTTAVLNFSQVLATDSALRIIVCNAGPMCTPPKLSRQGLEEQFATHHVGHSLLMLRLLQVRMERLHSRSMAVSAAPPLRMVILASAAAATGNPTAQTTFHEWGSVAELEQHLSRFRSYGNAKMCVLLFAFALARFVHQQRLLSPSCTVNVLHPGPIRSRVIPNSQLPWRWLLDGEAAGLLRMTPVIASMFVTDLALSERYERVSGHFFRMGEDQTLRYRDMVLEARHRRGVFTNSTLFPGIPGPAVSLSLAKQQWMWITTMNYFASKDLVDTRMFSLL